MKLILACLGSLLACLGSPVDYWPEDYPGNDQSKIRSAIAACISNPDACGTLRLDFKPVVGPKPRTCWAVYEPLVIRDPLGRTLYGLRIVGDPRFSSFQSSADGAVLTIDGAKDLSIRDLSIFRTSPVMGPGLVLIARGSLNPGVDNLKVQNASVGLLIDGNTADVSRIKITYSNFTKCGKGVKIIGANALDPKIEATGSECGTLVDLTEGGADFDLDLGGSSNGRELLVNGGYSGFVKVISELNRGHVIEATGYDQGSLIRVQCHDIRECAQPAFVFAGNFEIDLGWRGGNGVKARVESRTGTATIKGATGPVDLRGKWLVNGLPKPQ